MLLPKAGALDAAAPKLDGFPKAVLEPGVDDCPNVVFPPGAEVCPKVDPPVVVAA